VSESPISHSTGEGLGEPTATNAGEDAVMGTVAEMEPTDIGDQLPMDHFTKPKEAPPEE